MKCCPLECYESVDETICDECPFKGTYNPTSITEEVKIW